MTVSPVDRRGGNLPADLTSFVGRRHEIADVKNRFASSRLVTLTGMGGVGKTRLALRVAWDVRRAYPDGAWMVELAGLRAPNLVGPTVASALGLQDRSVDTSVNWLCAMLADRQMLIVIDNCEHLLDASAVLSNAVLRSCPGVRILATSRQALGIGGEHVLTVPPMPTPVIGGAESADGLGRYESVRLFVERAIAVRPGFRLDNANQEAVSKICRRLEGIPLAIELAASRLSALSVDELMDRLDDRYALLSRGSRAALPRQQTLRSLIDWSFDLCSDAERALWARLSVFAGGFDLDAAESVCAGGAIASDAVWDLVTQLVDKSIVLATSGSDGVRYQLSETLREYGQERLLELGATGQVQARHRRFYWELTLGAEAGWFGASQLPLLARLRVEHANLREALNSYLSPGADAEHGLDLASALRFYWVVSGRVKEGRHWLEQLLASCEASGPTRLKALCVSGYLATLVSDWDGATSLLGEARSLATDLGDKRSGALVAQVEGLGALFRNDPARAESLFGAALSSHRDLSDAAAAVYDQVELALAAALLGDGERAIQLLEECLSVCQPTGEHWLTSLALWAVGIERCKRGEYRQAASAELESLRLRVALGDRWSAALNLQVLGWIAAAEGDGTRAAQLLGAADASAQSVGLSPAALGHLLPLQHSYEGIGRRRLTDKAFDLAYDQGLGAGFEEAVLLAQGKLTSSGEDAEGTSSDVGGLTRREREIAELVSRGMSNRDIAAALVISTRTAEAHVQHILTKLGLTSRTQVAAWTATDTPGSGS